MRNPRHAEPYMAVRLPGMAVLVAAILVVSAQPGMADGDNPHVWEPETRSVAVFKNGLGFFIQEGEVELRNGWCAGGRIPPAAFGAFAVYSADEAETVDIVGAGQGEVVEFDGVDTPDTPQAKAALLESHVGISLSLDYTQKGKARTAHGRVVAVGDTFVVLENEENSLAVPIDGISRMQLADLPIRVHVSEEDGDAAGKSRLGMAYLRKGITWVPAYTLRIIDDTTAELTLRGTLINEAEDLVHADVHFVVGAPHFAHSDQLAPIAVGQIIRAVGAEVDAQIRNQIMNRALICSNLDNDAPGIAVQQVETGEEALGQAVANLPRMDGPAATDYTVYTKRDLTVRRGEKAIVTLFVKKIDYGHIYRWSPPGRIQHLLSLLNDTDTAWTTGPCLAVSGERPLSEDILSYTPKAAKAELPVTTAINIAHEQHETEIDRAYKAQSIGRDTFLDLVTLEGSLTIANYEAKDVDVVISVPVPGRPISASDEGKISIDATKLELSERRGAVRWKVAVAPGKTKELTYQYERFVRSQ